MFQARNFGTLRLITRMDPTSTEPLQHYQKIFHARVTLSALRTPMSPMSDMSGCRPSECFDSASKELQPPIPIHVSLLEFRGAMP